MAVIVSFTADVTQGDPPYDVQFTDTSTGGPNRWLWDLGDGTYSFEQHPSHTYDGVGGDKFSVKLIAWIFNIKTSVGTSAKQGKNLGPGTLLFDYFYNTSVWGASGGDNREPYFFHQKITTTQHIFGAKKSTLTLNPAQETPPVIYIAEATFKNNAWGVGSLEVFGGGLEISRLSDGKIYSSSEDVSVLGTSIPLANITDEGNDTYIFQLKELDAIGAIGEDAGFAADILIQKYTVASADDYDEHEEVDFIVIGIPPVANFYASPTKGRNPLFTGFVNTSTLAIGAATSYIWKKRLSGSGAAFQTFSTTDNPVHLFDRDNP